MANVNLEIAYSAMPKQAEAHKLAAKYRGFCGGWGNGKTSWGCAETFIRCHEFPGTRWIVARKTRPELKATTWDMLVNGDMSQPTGWHGIPKETMKGGKWNKSDLVIEFINGSVIYGLPLDDPKKLENYNLGGFWIDQAEEVEEDIFLKFHGRLRQLEAPREGLLTFNPNGHNWLWEKFINEERDEVTKQRYQCIEATPMDNPNLPDDYIEQFSGLPDHWFERFVLGSHEVFTGQIFVDYEPDVHVIEPFPIPSAWERWLSIDPGIRHEGCLSWCARDFEGNVYYYREILKANEPVSWWASQIFKAEHENDWGGPDEHVYRRLIGPEARIRAQTDGKTVLSVFNECGVYPEIADKDPVARISRITEHLRREPGRTHPFLPVSPAPRLFIFSECDKLREYLPQYRWKPQRTNFTEEDAPEAPRKKDDHNIDNLGHILVAIDGLPEMETKDRIQDTEAAWAEEHFLRELEEAMNARGEGYTVAGTAVNSIEEAY